MRSSILFMTLCLASLACDDGGGGGADPDMAPQPDGGFDPDGPTADAADAGGDRAADAQAGDASAADWGLDGAADLGSSDAGPDAAALDGAAADVDLPDVPNLGECASPADCLDFRACVGGACVDNQASEWAGALVLNEVLVDGALDVDANDDGDIDPVDDEFIELVNVTGEALDLSGFLVVERDLQGIPRHIFPDDTTLPAGEALVVFGGGAPSAALEATPGATFVVVNAADPAFSNGLNLDDGGDTLRVLDPIGHEVVVYAYGEGCERPPCAPIGDDRSVTRDPDLVGEFGPHPEAVMSPGTQVDGEPFQ